MALLHAIGTAPIGASPTTRQVPEAQALFDEFCGSSSALLRAAAERRAAIERQLNVSNLPNTHLALAVS